MSLLDQLDSEFPTLNISATENDDSITLHKVIVPKNARGAGEGSRFMQALISIADATGKRILLSPSKDFGATSVDRLVRFYKRFGFKENKGKQKDFTTRETMIREPKKSISRIANAIRKLSNQ